MYSLWQDMGAGAYVCTLVHVLYLYPISRFTCTYILILGDVTHVMYGCYTCVVFLGFYTNPFYSVTRLAGFGRQMFHSYILIHMYILYVYHLFAASTCLGRNLSSIEGDEEKEGVETKSVNECNE